MSIQSETRRIYVACLSSYNAGKLYGAWVDAGQDADDIKAEVAEMLRGSPCPNTMTGCPECDGAGVVIVCDRCDGAGKVPTAEEWAVHEWEGFGEIKLGEHPDLDTVAEVAEALDEHGEAYEKWYANESRSGAEVDSFQEQYRGTFRTLGDWAEDWMDQTGGLDDMPKNLRPYFDFDAFGRDAEMGGDIWTAEGGDGIFVYDNH